MGDPLSVVAGVVGILAFGIKTIDQLSSFYNAYKDKDKNITHTVEKLQDVLVILRSVETSVQTRKSKPDADALLGQTESSLQQCKDLIQELDAEYRKLEAVPVADIKQRVQNTGRRALYPFRQSTLQKLEEDIDELRSRLATSIDALQLRDNTAIRDDIADVRSLLEAVRLTQISALLRDWLNAPDATVEHTAACATRHSGTGTWFVKSDVFSSWLDQSNSFLWLHGFAGCGKTVLCSTSIQYTLRRKRSSQNVGVAFFYITFRDQSKQKANAMLRALLIQLVSQIPEGEAFLGRWYDPYQSGGLPTPTLLDVLKSLVRQFRDVYLLIDALDESPRFKERDHVLDAIQVIRNWSLPQVHLLVTARDEPDIRDSLDTVAEKITMKNTSVDEDIGEYIAERLRSDRRLRKWKDYNAHIQAELTRKAHGNFRWVECQFGALRRCKDSKFHLDECLRSLPRDLNETYEQMLSRIDEDAVEEAHRILTLLCFCGRPLAIRELLSALAVTFHPSVGIDDRRQLQNADSLRDICPGLIEFGTAGGTTNENEKEEQHAELDQIVRIAHFSIQEYLESAHITESKVNMYALASGPAHEEIAKICCSYLCDPRLAENSPELALEKFPLAPFAAKGWYHHYTKATSPGPLMQRLINQIFNTREIFLIWMTLNDLEQSTSHKESKNYVLAAAYYASLLGLDFVLRSLTTEGGLIEQGTGKVHQTDLDNMLQAAASRGHSTTVQLLLNMGAEVRTRGGKYGNCLQAAIYSGNVAVVRMILDAGADVNEQVESGDSFYRINCINALQTAAYNDQSEIVQLLLDAGADVNAQDQDSLPGRFGSAIQAAAAEGHAAIVQQLLHHGARVNVKGGEHGTALQAAAGRGHRDVVQVLLEAGADVNVSRYIPYSAVRNGVYVRFVSALQAAAYGGDEWIMKRLLGRRANANYHGGEFGTALTAAAYRANEKAVDLLLAAKADVNADGGDYGTALRAAAYGGNADIVRKLLDAGAEVDEKTSDHTIPRANPSEFASAVHIAAAKGHVQVVKLLIAAGANVNRRGLNTFRTNEPDHKNALEAAVLHGHLEITQMLLDAGAGFTFSRAIEHAASYGHIGIIRLFLDASTGSSRNKEYSNMLAHAASGGQLEIMKMLLSAGAEINYKGLEGRVLEGAARGGDESVVRFLLDAGAQVNPSEGSENALTAAAYNDRIDLVRILLDAGANINARNSYHGTALDAAAARSGVEMIQLLLNAGADVDASNEALPNAVPSNDVAVIAALLAAGANPNAQNRWREPALLLAVHRGSLAIIQILLDAGAEVNFEGTYGRALQVAAKDGNLEMVRTLLAAGADLHLEDRNGSVLAAAVESQDKDVVQFLLDAGATSTTGGGKYRDTLSKAAIYGSLEILQKLLDAGVASDLPDGGYSEALQEAALYGGPQSVKFLLDAAVVTLSRDDYNSALYNASFRGNSETVQILLDAGADVNSKGGEYGTPLKAAASGPVQSDRQKVVDLLLQAGADVNARDGKGESALDVAYFQQWDSYDGGSRKIISRLLEAGAKSKLDGIDANTAAEDTTSIQIE